MKILYPIGGFYPDQTGGPSNTVYWMAKALVKQGHEVTVVTTDFGLNGRYPSDQWVFVDGIKVRYCKNSNGGLQPKLVWHSLKCLLQMDVVHLTSIKCLFSFIIACFAKLKKKKVIWSVRGELADAANSRYSGLGASIRRCYFKCVYIRFQKSVIFHSTASKEDVEIRTLMPQVKVIQIPNYMELPIKLPFSDRKQMLYIGRINPIKKIENLIDALFLSKRFKYSDIKLVIVGQVFPQSCKSYLDDLKKQVKRLGLEHKVKFERPVEGLEKQELFASSYCSFLISESENFGNVVIEAMAQGTPVVTSLGTPWSILKENNVGYHIKNDPLSIAQVVDEVLAMPTDEYHQLRKRTYEFCVKDFSVFQNIGKWENIYENFSVYKKL